MQDNSWAIEELVSIIKEKESIINKMIVEICKLRKIDCNYENFKKIKKEFE